MFGKVTVGLTLLVIFSGCLALQATAQICPTISDLINQTPLQSVSAEEMAGLMFMREEEKMARDVYLDLFEKWGSPIFQNIARAEQQHIDSILMIMVKYNIDDPLPEDERGRFSIPELQSLYTDLRTSGLGSVQEALRVGAAVEDLDLSDLDLHLDQTDNVDIRIVYQNLAKGSRNHLRAFARNLLAQGVIYNAQYIEQSTMDRILSDSQERGIYSEDGDPLCFGKGRSGNGGDGSEPD
jgi:hypothetical protein